MHMQPQAREMGRPYMQTQDPESSEVPIPKQLNPQIPKAAIAHSIHCSSLLWDTSNDP